ncbi:unnamed protein product [Lymnaea stagnalis]|uniref:Uncharacterized protein n=1 Tax=Lymnaea stagnalis TaxID=6523 RepID=A0AAV2IMK3_LYMST
MQSSKEQQSARRASMPTTVGSRKPSSGSLATSTGSTASSSKVKPGAQKSSESSQSAVSAPAPSQTGSSSSSVNTTPIILAPVSQVRSPRRNSRAELGAGDKSVSWDPEQYNPDGSLRTVHRLPGFDQSYAQAMKARYIRHRTVVDREKELTVNQIFDKP